MSNANHFNKIVTYYSAIIIIISFFLIRKKVFQVKFTKVDYLHL